ncbi:chloride channel protein C-like isoform X2 [Mytilus edulis]|uniref:chloride channel protein C-like isoform X2 n=1 Tax=Mytilus edulis TaxID=6550 RepID=UPI0039EEBD8C
MSAYVLQHDIEDQQTGEAPSLPEPSNENNVRNRGPWKKSGHSVEPPRDDAVYYPKDDTYGVFAQGRDYEPVYITHKYTEEEKKTLSSFESEDYLPSHSEIYKSWLRRQGPLGYMLGKWIIMGLIGFCVGIIGFLLHNLSEEIAKLKWHMVEKYLKNQDFAVASLFATGYSVIFVLFSAFIVVFLRPSASGSGIPEVSGFLNGTHLRHIFNIKTLAVKFFSCVAAVGCGLPVGPEGPMIHMGALVGAGLSQFKSETLRLTIPVFERFRTSEDKRNFISAGAAAGVSSAFGAPVGGLLFSMEEVSSFWTTTLSWQIFFCCMIATFTTDLFNSAFDGFSYTGNFGQFKTQRYILFQIEKGIDVNILMFIPTMIIGVIGGILGAVFTIMTLKMARGRKRLLNAISNEWVQKIVRIFEPALIMIIVTVFSLYLPGAFSCTKKFCIESKLGSPIENCLNDTRNPLHVEHNVRKYTCPDCKDWQESETTWKTNCTYNEMATLMFGTLEQAVEHLFSRDTHLEFGYGSLLTALVFYFIMICWATGTSVSCGALVPMLLVGALYGRLIGVLMTSMFGVHSEDTGYWAWIDPGSFALIGAASFFGGVTRLTLAVTVIMMELTNDVQILLPVMVAVMVAKWVGDFFTHPVYHALMEMKCIPFLDPEPRVTIEKKRIELELYCARDIMASPVITIQRRELVTVLSNLLLNTTHSGFPIVKTTKYGDHCFLGIIGRLELTVLLMNERIFQTGSLAADNIEPQASWIDYEQMNITKLANPLVVSEALHRYSEEESYKEKYIDLSKYMNDSGLAVPEKFSVQRTYIIFRTLGLRHLTVIDTSNQVTGIITRKDLMGHNIVEKLSKIISQPSRLEMMEINDNGAV